MEKPSLLPGFASHFENLLKGKDGVTMSKKDFEKEHKHLVKVLREGSKEEQEAEADDQEEELNEHEKELKKAVLDHLLQGDYDRIIEFKENYPIQPFMNLLGKQDTIVPIDLDRLFMEKAKIPTTRYRNGKTQILINGRWHNQASEAGVEYLKQKHGEFSNEHVDAKVEFEQSKYDTKAPRKEKQVKENPSDKYTRYTDKQLFDFVDNIILPKACVYKGDVYDDENSKTDPKFLLFKKRFETEVNRNTWYKSRGVAFETFSDGDLHRMFGMARKQLLKAKQGK